MFSFLKQKLKDAVSIITKKFESEEKPIENIKEEVITKPINEEQKEVKEEQKEGAVKEKVLVEPVTKEVPAKEKKIAVEKKKESPEKKISVIEPVQKQKIAEKPKESRRIEVELIKPLPKIEAPKEKYTEEESTSFFGRLAQKITTTRISLQEFEEMFWELEVSLLENNVALEVIELMKQKLQTTLVDKPLKRGQITKIIMTALKETIDEVLSFEQVDLLKKTKSKKPYVICFVGINGSGKTTTIAKVGNYLKKNKISCIIAAGDTFRAAAIQQLEEHANRLNIKLIKQDYGADAAAVAYDAIAYAKAHDIDVVLIDTAGRMHSNVNLMDEMKKIIRVAKPDMTLFIGESITGNDCIEQARRFNESIGISGIVLAKADVDEKGGAALSIAYVTGKPILFLGIGQGYEDLKPFSKELILQNLGLEGLI